MEELVRIAGKIESITFGGFGWPPSGEMKISLLETQISLPIILTIASKADGNANDIDEIIKKWQLLIKKYAKNDIVKIKYYETGKNEGSIIWVFD